MDRQMRLHVFGDVSLAQLAHGALCLAVQQSAHQDAQLLKCEWLGQHPTTAALRRFLQYRVGGKTCDEQDL
ncbi:hypothetical protein AO735_08370 [Pseudomonas sp. TTU2014-096BSC]|nr:hypothetical protein AO735_08370 [Pseudomonas sp. TTU2014-096BSC]